MILIFPLPKWQQRSVINCSPQIPASKVCLLESNLRAVLDQSDNNYFKSQKLKFREETENTVFTKPEQWQEEAFHSSLLKQKSHQVQICVDGPSHEEFHLFLLVLGHLGEIHKACHEIPAEEEEL